MDACTAAALDVITAFAVPSLDSFRKSLSIFLGLVASELPRSLSLLRISDFSLKPTLSTVDKANARRCRSLEDVTRVTGVG
jgi:hypothetical protein